MKLTLKQIPKGEDEVIIKYKQMNEQIETITSVVEGSNPKINGYVDGEWFLLAPENIYYFESVDGATYAYRKDMVCRVNESLEQISLHFENFGMFRCSKSMVLNIYKIRHLKSEAGNRIRATMENDEQVIISRRYASLLRQILKGGRDYE